MNHTESEIVKFITDIQSLYGEYNSAQKKVVYIWLSKYNGKLPVLYAQVLKSVSWQYKSPPGPKEFEEAAKVIYKDKLESERPEYQTFQPLQIEEDILHGEEAAEKLKEIFEPLKKKMNIKFTGGEDETN